MLTNITINRSYSIGSTSQLRSIVNLLKTDEKQLNNIAEYFLGVVKLALYCYNTHFLWRGINQ
jgi:hypothetical protein